LPSAKTAVEMPDVPDFSHVNINDINPDFEAIETDFYPVQLVKVQEFTKVFEELIKSGPNAGNPNPRAGQEYKQLSLHFAIVDGEFAGRRVFKTLFEGSTKDYKFVARVARAVSIPQEDTDSSLAEYLTRISEAEVPFKAKINKTPDDPYNDNAIDEFDIQPL